MLGICGFVVCPLVCSVLAVVYGKRARREIRIAAGRQSGESLATAGVVLGWIGIALSVLGILFFVAMLVLVSSATVVGIESS